MCYAAVSFCCICVRFGTVKAGAQRWNCHEMMCPTRGAPNFPYHRLDCHIVMLVLSTAYQWMAGEIPCIDGIRGLLGAANAGAWCHDGHDMMVNHTMIIWHCNFDDRDPLIMVHTTNTNGLLLTNEDHSPLPIHIRNNVYMIWPWIGGVDSTLRTK